MASSGFPSQAPIGDSKPLGPGLQPLEPRGGTARAAVAVTDPIAAPAPADGAEPGGARERILDIALELFTTQGYDTTSLRQIAEQLGFSKAAIYYHFSSKADILLALHLRLHEFGHEAFESLDRAGPAPEDWAGLLDRFVAQMLAHRGLFVLHERNRVAIEHLHRDRHHAEHDDLESRFRELLANEDVTVRDRVRLACAFGAVMGGLVLAGEAFAQVPTEQLGAMVRGAVDDLLSPSATRV